MSNTGRFLTEKEYEHDALAAAEHGQEKPVTKAFLRALNTAKG